MYQMSILNIATIIVAALIGVYWYLRKVRLTYWKRQGVPYIEPEFYYGNFRSLIKMETPSAFQYQQIYWDLKNRGLRHGGAYMFFTPIYVPIDIELVKCVLQKDFDHFVNHGTYYNPKDDPLGAHLFHLENTKWKNVRSKLTPTFTSGKMRMMFQTVVDCSDGLVEAINEYSTVQDAVDIKELLARFTTDVIGSCAFGLDFESLKKSDSEFRKYGRKIFEPNVILTMRRLATTLFPHDLLRKVGFRLTRKEVETFFLKIVKDTVEYREKNNIVRNDFLHLMIQLRNKGEITDEKNIFNKELNNKNQSFLTMNEMSAHCYVFFMAGFETSSTTMTFALYELSRNQDIQEKLREEIRSVLKKHDDKLTYDSIMEMSYLDKIVNETLRLHPPLPVISRVCNKTYHVPGTDFVLEAGTHVQIPSYEIHHDPEYYPNPDVFDPERFTEENKAKRPSCTFLPFGEGPRICIGMRFGIMQSKVGLVRLIKDYKITLNERTIDPFEYDRTSRLLSVKDDVWLNVSKLNSPVDVKLHTQ